MAETVRKVAGFMASPSLSRRWPMRLAHLRETPSRSAAAPVNLRHEPEANHWFFQLSLTNSRVLHLHPTNFRYRTYYYYGLRPHTRISGYVLWDDQNDRWAVALPQRPLCTAECLNPSCNTSRAIGARTDCAVYLHPCASRVRDDPESRISSC